MKAKLRSQAWFGGANREAFIHRSWMRGFPADVFGGRPVIGICNTYSELTPCNAHLRALTDCVKHGVWEAGGFPREFPVMSLGESNPRPTAMLFRNLASMDVEESIRGNSIDGVVLLVGCDKTTPVLLMGSASCDLPTMAVSGGPMLRGKFRGANIGSCTDLWRFSEEVKARLMSAADFAAVETSMIRSAGRCNTMDTASTMACMMVEALGVGLPGNAAISAVDSRRSVLAQKAGRRIVELVREDVALSGILTRPAFENAIRVNAAIGGWSTNAVIHLIAVAGRLGVLPTLDDWDQLGRDIPTMLDLPPAGRFLMEDFAYAGGLQWIMRQLGEAGPLSQDALTVNGKTLWENVSRAEVFNVEAIRPFDSPVRSNAGIARLKGNLAPNGAVIKSSAATPALMKHAGRAVVFEDIDDNQARIDDPALDIDETCVMALKYCGPRGYSGMPEVGNMSLPKKILTPVITDMVRISDARMSGTAYGTVVLHVLPEGALALVYNDDRISLDVPALTFSLEVDEVEIARRRAEWKALVSTAMPGYQTLHVHHTLQADRGCDLDFLVGRRRAGIPREPH